MLKFLVSFLFAFNAAAYTGTGVVGTTTQNPATNAVLVTTGALTSTSTANPKSANYTATVNWYCSAAATYLYQVLNSSSVVVSTITLPCPANIRQTYQAPGMSFKIPDGYSLQVIVSASFTGYAQAEIYYAVEGNN